MGAAAAFAGLGLGARFGAAGVAAPLPTRDRRPAPVHLSEHEAGRHTSEARDPAAAATTPSAPAAPKRGPKPNPAKAAAAPRPAEPQASYDPLAPRLRPPGTASDRQSREREVRKARARLTDVERKIAEKERAVRDVEALMASPGFYEDRARADKAVAERQGLLDEVAALMTEWESLQTAVEANG